MILNTGSLKNVDREIASLLDKELQRQNLTINLIASENFVSPAVLEIQGSILTNKYAEGYPGRRYYGGCQYMDQIENLAISRAKNLFHAEHVNVQPHSGTQANMAVYFSCLREGDTILGMKLSHGGHLSHGSQANFSGRFFNVVTYGVNRKTYLIDYDEIRDLARKHKPRLIISGASSYPRIIEFKILKEIADEVDSLLMADIAHVAGLVVTNLHPNPVGYADFVTATTHKSLKGPRGGLVICNKRFANEVDRQVFPGIQGGPLMHTIAAKAVAFHEASSPDFVEYQKKVLLNAQVLVEELKKEGYSFVSGGTDTQIILMDLTPLNITGKEAERALDEGGITVNKNKIPFDEKGPTVTSGIRLGTLGVATRGMGPEEMKIIARFISTILSNHTDTVKLKQVKKEVTDICSKFPVYTFKN